MQFCFYSGFNQMLAEKGMEATAQWAQEQGFSSVEFLQLNVENWHRGVENIPQAQQMKHILQAHGLTTACYSVGINLLNGETAKAFLKEQAQLAAELGSPFLHHTLIDSLVLPPNAPTFGEVFDDILDSATEIALYCQKLGLTCLYEEQGLYFNGRKNFHRFFTEIKKRCQNVGVCGDLGNILFVDESPTDFLSAFAADVKHVHLKDYKTATATDTPTIEDGWLQTKNGTYIQDVPLGEGIINLPACLEILKNANYCGAFSLEVIEPILHAAPAMQLVKELLK